MSDSFQSDIKQVRPEELDRLFTELEEAKQYIVWHREAIAAGLGYLREIAGLGYLREIAKLRAENEKMMNRLRNPELTWAENSRLRAENEALDRSHKDLAHKLADAGREIDRLRAILAIHGEAPSASQEC